MTPATLWRIGELSCGPRGRLPGNVWLLTAPSPSLSELSRRPAWALARIVSPPGGPGKAIPGIFPEVYPVPRGSCGALEIVPLYPFAHQVLLDEPLTVPRSRLLWRLRLRRVEGG